MHKPIGLFMMMAFLFVVLAAVDALSADVVGTLTDASGAPVVGVGIGVRSLDQSQVTSAVTNASGKYAVRGLNPGTYLFTMNPGATGYRGDTFETYLNHQGLTMKWAVSKTAPAVASAVPGVSAAISAAADSSAASGSAVTASSSSAPVVTAPSSTPLITASATRDPRPRPCLCPRRHPHCLLPAPHGPRCRPLSPGR